MGDCRLAKLPKEGTHNGGKWLHCCAGSSACP